LRILRIVYLVVGLGLLAAILYSVDLAAAGAWLGRMGPLGIVSVIVVYALVFTCDSAAWWLILAGPRPEGVWLGRLWMTRLVGEAFNAIIPAASLGGEPVKALLLKKRHGVGYGEAAASLVMAKTTTLIGLILFCALGLALMMGGSKIADDYGVVAGAGLAALTAGVLGFFAVQRWGVASRLAARLAAKRPGGRLETALGHLRDIDERFAGFYRRRPGRFAGALGLVLTGWLLGAFELYVILDFLGNSITPAEALITESVLQLVRAGSFFIPVNLGASEVGFVVLVGALTGQPSLGLAAALVRRARELLWIVAGLALGWRFSFSPSVVAAELAEPRE
jgi:uncharacterized protein (TIRG00374 family)